MRMRIYNFLVNRHGGIRSRYHKFHDNGGIYRRSASYLYLLFLNFCFYFLFCRFLGKEEGMAVYEEKRLPEAPESALHAGKELTVGHFVEELSQYDVVSFDVFDTLLFRPFSSPADLFYFLGERLGLLDIKRIRVEQEALARKECYEKQGHYEVTLEEIWERMEREVGVSAAEGMKLEQELETEFCYANPFMQKVFEAVRARGKEVIAISDMYLPPSFLAGLLEKNGYQGIAGLYVSCDHKKSKKSGELYQLARGQYSPETTFIHVGDNEHSDVRMAGKNGFASMYYPNINKMSQAFRPDDMSPMVGGAYRGIVNHRLYQGGSVYSLEYEYGFIYGGLFVLGYCHFIHEYCRSRGVDKLLFLSRDGDILKQVYDKLYPEDNTAYVHWSRGAATRLMAGVDRYDYFRRYLYHKVNQGITLGEALEAMGLGDLCKLPCQKLQLWDELTDRNVEALKGFIQSHFHEVRSGDQGNQQAAQAYFGKELAGVHNAAAIDIGWAGSGAVSLSYLVERVWRLPCKVNGIIAGTNTLHNAEPDAGEPFLQSGKLVSYLFSQSHNRDVMKKHDPGRDYNIYWELLLSSPRRRFLGFGFEEGEPTGIYAEDGREVLLSFGEKDANQEGIGEIRQGIWDFVSDYTEHFQKAPFMLRISGRDACAPMLVAASHGEKYLKRLAGRFAPERGV